MKIAKPRKVAIPLPTEYQEQCIVAEYLDTLKRQGKIKRWTATLNGVRLSIGAAVKAKKMGAREGAPDLFIFGPPPVGIHSAEMDYSELRGVCGAVIEMKRQKKGTLSEIQAQWLADLSNMGWLTARCDGAAAAIAQLKEWGY